MTEQLVSLKTKSILHDKGFFNGGFNIDIRPTSNLPTQSLVQKWLREVHNTHIEIEAACDCELMILMPYVYQFYIYIDGDGYFDGLFYNTYERCLEAAINESLKLIK